MNTTVLVIDDAADVHRLLAVRLQPECVRILSAMGWEDGLELAISASPDVILLDVDMRGHSGLELCGALKADPRTAAIPVIFLTGSTDVATKVSAFDLGAIDYVTKPFHPAELRARVRSALRTKRYQDLLTQRAQLDALTGLHNRGYFDAFLRESAAAAYRQRRPLSLVLLDLDHFKSMNDRFGHPFGDRVLQRTGEAVGNAVRAGDAACRYGGEELAVILPGVALADAMKVAERIRSAVAAIELRPRGERVPVAASFGVAAADAEAAGAGDGDGAALVAAADRALYAAKASGRNRVCAAEREALAA